MKTVTQGRCSHILRSMATSARIATTVLIRRMFGRPLVAQWPFLVEYGTLFFRAQFSHAFRLSHTIAESRAYFDSVYGLLETYPDVDIKPTCQGEPRGHWFIPKTRHSNATLLHFHGGGYTFYAAVSHHFAACLAHTLGVTVFAPDYRLTPEHPHPAQLDDGLAAYAYLINKGIDPATLILCGDSAGGHLALMTLTKLTQAHLPKPALTLGLSPWTDIGRRGKSQFGNDRFDLVQGNMTLQFAAWLKGGQALSDEELSPIHQDFKDLGPIYLQAGGKEILVDMIRDFAAELATRGAQVRLDTWEHMMHEFQTYGDYLPESRDALNRLRECIAWALGKPHRFSADAQTETDSL